MIDYILAASYLLGAILAIVCVYWLLKAVFKKHSIYNSFGYNCIKNRTAVSFVFVVLLTGMMLYWSIDRYVNFLPDGTYCCNLFVENSKGQKYTLPTEVHLVSDGNENKCYTYITLDNKTKKTYSSAYFERAYWPNGGWLYFGDDVRAIPNEMFVAYDQDEKMWDCRLSKYMTNNKHIFTYHEGNSYEEILYSSLSSFIILLYYSICFYNKTKESRKQ